MTTALVASTTELHFQQSDLAFREEINQIRDVIGQYHRDVTERELLHSILFSGDRVSKINQLLDDGAKPGEGNHGVYRIPHSIDLDYVRGNLRAKYWQRVVDMTNILQLMPARLRDEWREQFIEGKVKVDKPDPYTAGRMRTVTEYVGVPEFSEDSVIPTLLGLLNDRNMYLNERVYGVFCALSPKHKTNKSYGFSDRLILTNVISDFWSNSVSTSTYREDSIDDLRVVLRFFAHGRFGRVERLATVLSDVYRADPSTATRNFGKWVPIDGNLLRIKMFMNGNLHIEIHPDVAWKLNEVLAASLPYAIPTEFRSTPKNKRAAKEFGEILIPVDEDVANLIVAMDKPEKSTGVYSSFGYHWKNSTGETKKQYVGIMRKLGGVRDNSDSRWSFPYEFCEIRDFVLKNRCLPDQKTYQFYPTPELLQRLVTDLIELQDSDRLLEPSAGRGDLLTFIDAPQQTTCIELAPLFCKILESKGYSPINADFLKWSDENASVMFDKIAMNPPYSEGRAKTHVEAAIRHLKAGGRCVAVMPGSERMQWIDESQFKVEECATYSNEFEDTGVMVKVFTIDRI
ncbi:DUF4942 domain-containing protein [Xenorhabdus sp. PR6a]|uniref:DUF4942 domain-containing protein n=1 Tax=Xenorhabdus sp. PR6a TaxID=3025877 RepID=UPI0023598FD4|nr:DUF4942 domain-containing protein [Xenorhabdus sp. PR6a]MDC9582766.1 DUF4942 domain-containing protein [Xenorhabdus sp. PR6a]